MCICVYLHYLHSHLSPCTCNSQTLFSNMVESLRKDVECTFGILKGCFSILRYGSRFMDVKLCDAIFLTCCGLHNVRKKDIGLKSLMSLPVDAPALVSRPWQDESVPEEEYVYVDLHGHVPVPVNAVDLSASVLAGEIDVEDTDGDSTVRLHTTSVTSSESNGGGMQSYGTFVDLQSQADVPLYIGALDESVNKVLKNTELLKHNHRKEVAVDHFTYMRTTNKLTKQWKGSN